jgi:hypothetical protein
MLVLLAIICFIIAQFRAELAGVNLLLLGLTLFAAHFLFGGEWRPQRPNR